MTEILVPIYNIRYGTSCKKPCDAIVAAENDHEAESLLETAIKNDERVHEAFRKNPGLEFMSNIESVYKSDAKGVIYFE